MNAAEGNSSVQNLKLLLALAVCSALVLAFGYAATSWSVHSQLEAATTVVNRVAKRDRLEIVRPVGEGTEVALSR